MKYTKAHGARQHFNILAGASRLFRARGISGTSIVEIMRASGLTVGGFYAHFDSKEALARESLEHALKEFAKQFEETVALNDSAKSDFLNSYLNTWHRDHPETGCVMACLASEIAREPGLKHSFTQGFRELLKLFSAGLTWRNDRPTQGQAICFMSAMIGAMILARAVDDTELSSHILESTRSELFRY